MRRVAVGICWLAVLVAFTFACGDGSTSPGRAVALAVVSGDEQSAPAGAELPNALVVRVTDANGQPVQGQVVNFRVTAGDGSMFAGAGSTNSEGIVRDRWTLGTVPGKQTAEARAVDNETGAAIVFAKFTATAVDTTTPPPPPPPPPPVFGSVVILSGAQQTAVYGTRLPKPVVFLILDLRNRPLPGFTFTLRSQACFYSNGFNCSDSGDGGDDQLANPVLTTGPDGTATFSGWTLGQTPGTKCLAVFPGTTGSNSPLALMAVCATATPGPLTQLVVRVMPENVSTAEVDVQAQDEAGHVIDGIPVTFTPSPGSSVSPAFDTTRQIPVSHEVVAITHWTVPVPPATLTITAGGVSTSVNW